MIALRQRDQRGRGPRLAAEVLEIRGDHEAGAWDIDAAHDPKHVRSIVGEPAARVGEVVRILPERAGRGQSTELLARGGRPAGHLEPGGP